MPSQALHPFADTLPQEAQLPYLSPDFSESQSVAMRANSIFDQGISQVKNDFSSVLNAQVTGDEMNAKKQEYVNNFKQGLKKIAPGDLTMPQNVVQAENLLQPFWSDQGMLSNMSITKLGTGNISTIQQGMLSKDPKERDMYSNYQVMDQQDMLSELASAGTDMDKISKVQKRTITPFYNINNLATEWAGKDGLKIGYTTGTGTPYIVSTTGGLQTVPNYKTWLRGHIEAESNMAGMYQTIGRVTANATKRRVLQENPNLEGQGLNDAIANHAYSIMDNSYQNSISNYTTSISSLDRQMDELKKRGAADMDGKGKPVHADQMAQYAQLYRLKQDQQNYLEKESTDYTTFRSRKDATIKTYSSDPSEAFARQEKDNMIDAWATGMATNEQPADIKENTAYSAAQRLRHDYYATNVTRQNSLDDTRAKYNDEDGKMMRAGWERDRNGKWAYTGVGQDTTGTGKGQVSLVVSAASGTPQADNVGLKNIPATYDNYIKNTVTDPIKEAHNSLLGINGLAGTLEGTAIVVDGKSDILSTRDIDMANEALGAKFDDPAYVYNPQQLAAVKKLAASVGLTPRKNGLPVNDPNTPSQIQLFRGSADDDILDPQRIVTALEAKMGKVEVDKDGVPNMQSYARAVMAINVETKLQEGLAHWNQIQTAVNHEVLSNPEQNKQLIVDGHLVTSRDIMPLISKLHLPIPAKELADAYLNGSVEAHPVADGIYITVNGRVVKPRLGEQLNPNEQFEPAKQGRWRGREQGKPQTVQDAWYELINKFGLPGEISQKLADVKKHVVGQIPKDQLATGLRGFASTYNDAIPTQKPFKDNASIALSNPANHVLMYRIDGEKPTDLLKPDEVNKVAELLKDPDNVQEFKPVPFGGTNGGPAAIVTFKGTKIGEGKGKPSEVGTVHESVIVDIDPNTKDPLLQYNQQYAGQGMYGDMTVGGHVYESNSVQQAHGYKPVITSVLAKDGSGRSPGVVITGTYGWINPSTGKMEQKNLKEALVEHGQKNSFSFNDQTPETIKKAVDNEGLTIMQQNIANYQTFRNNAKGNNLPTWADIEKQLEK